MNIKKNSESLLIGLGIATAYSTNMFAGQQIIVVDRIDLPVSAEALWGKVKDFDGLHHWHPYIEKCEIEFGNANTEGAVRVLKTKDGATVKEELLAYSQRGMTYSYRMNETPMPLRNFTSTVAVRKEGKSAHMEWISTFYVTDGTSDDDARKMVSSFHKAGLNSLKFLP